MIKTALIGVGMMGKNHAKWLSHLSSFVAIADLDSKVGEEMSKIYGCKYYKDFKEMINKENIDAVVVATPTKTHEQICTELIKSKKNILVEKPISNDIKSAESIVFKSKRNNLVLLVGQIERFNPVVKKIMEILKNKEFGEMKSMNFLRAGPFPSRINDTSIVLDTMIHDIDILTRINGKKLDILKVISEKSKERNLLVKVIARVKIGENLCNIESNWKSDKRQREIEIKFNNGFVKADLLNKEIIVNKNEETEKIILDDQDSLKNEIRYFLELVENNKRDDNDIILQSLSSALEIERVALNN